MHHARIDFGEIVLRRPISPKWALRNASQRCVEGRKIEPHFFSEKLVGRDFYLVTNLVSYIRSTGHGICLPLDLRKDRD